MNTTKIRLSPEEKELINRTDWILTKNRLIKRIQQLLSEVQISLQRELSECNWLPVELIHCSPKISKGENYMGLPWLMLDYPMANALKFLLFT